MRSPDDEAREMLRVAADGAHHERLSAPPGIEHPAQPVVLRPVLEPRREAGLDVLDLHQTHGTDRAVAHELPRMARHRVGGVAVRDREDAPVPAGPLHEIARLAEIVGDGLVADDIEPGVERRGGVRIVRVVGRHDRHRIDAVGTLALAPRAFRATSP